MAHTKKADFRKCFFCGYTADGCGVVLNNHEKVLKDPTNAFD